jgi:hypothetical protein
MATSRISRDDLEAKFRSVQEQLQGIADDKEQAAKGAAIAGGLLALVIAYLLGRRAGKRKSQFVEIRRV